MSNFALLDSGSVEIMDLMENTVTMDEVTGMQEYFKVITEK